MALKSYKKYLEDKTANQNNFSCSGKERRPVITETDLQFTKICLLSVNVKKISRKIIFKVLTAISSPLKALDRFTYLMHIAKPIALLVKMTKP